MINQTSTDLQLIEQAIRQNRNLKLLVGLILLSIAVFVIYQAQSSFLAQKTTFLISLFGLLLSFAGFYLCLSGLAKYDSYKQRVVQLLLQEPDKIVWVYYYKVESTPFGLRMFQFCSLHLNLSNYDKIVLYMPEDLILVLLPHLKTRLTKTSFGYSKHKEQLYNISPSLLVSEEE